MMKKPRQITKTADINELAAMARADGITEDTDIACWIIDRSQYWRSEGYYKIMEKIGGEK